MLIKKDLPTNGKKKIIKKILVPTDFSALADDAVHYAMKLAKGFNAAVILYHSFVPFESAFYPPAQRKEENKDVENNLIKRLARIKDALLKTNKDIPISVYVDRGPEGLRLIEFCKKRKIDLIVMGTKGASGLKEVVIGSFTAETMTKAPCPVLAIPQKWKFKIPKKITFASGYHKKDIQSIKFLLKWNGFFKTKINILHIDDGKQPTEAFAEYKRKIEKQSEGVSFQHIEGKDISKTILHSTLKAKTDVLALSPIRREGIWANLFHKSITKTIAYHIHMPILSIPINELSSKT